MIVLLSIFSEVQDPCALKSTPPEQCRVLPDRVGSFSSSHKKLIPSRAVSDLPLPVMGCAGPKKTLGSALHPLDSSRHTSGIELFLYIR